MRIRLMQLIDYWVGIPICAALSVWDKLIRLLPWPVKPFPVRKILFIELSEMGSAFLAYSVLTRAVEKVGKENVYFLIFEKNRESVDLLELIPRENVITISDSSFIAFACGALAAIAKLQSLRIDTCLDLELFSRATAILSYLSGASRRVGFDKFTEEGLYRGSFITHRVFLNNHQHIALNFLALLRALEVDNHELPLVKENVSPLLLPLPQVESTSQENVEMKGKILKLVPNLSTRHKIVVLNPDPGLLTLRGWPLERYKLLAEKILQSDPSTILFCMGLSRSSYFAELIFPANYKDRCINFCGHTASLKEVITLFQHSHLLVTNDSGPGHLAALAGIPAIVLFGPESPVKYAPLGDKITTLFANLSCSPCYSPANHRHSICTNNRCLQAISVDEVLTATQKYLNAA